MAKKRQFSVGGRTQGATAVVSQSGCVETRVDCCTLGLCETLGIAGAAAQLEPIPQS